ncbi:MAG: hypothetical protein ACTIB2_08930 [Brachybacterium tyrofermentans]
MSAAEIIPASQVVRSIASFLDTEAEAGQTPAYIARRGRLDGVMLRLDVWEQIREEGTRAIDLTERDELMDRLATGGAQQGTLGDVAAALRPSAVIAQLPVQHLPHARSDILTASRVAPDTRNLSGFLAHWTRGYLRGSSITDPARPGQTLERDVAPAYQDNQTPFRLVWSRSGDHREHSTLVAVRPLSGVMARAWTFAPPMDATNEGGA